MRAVRHPPCLCARISDPVIGYDGYPSHGSPRTCTSSCPAHIHISWASPLLRLCQPRRTLRKGHGVSRPAAHIWLNLRSRDDSALSRSGTNATMVNPKGKSYRLRERAAASTDKPRPRARPTELS